MTQPTKTYTERESWILTQCGVVMSIWRAGYTPNNSDVTAILEVLSGYEDEVLALAFRKAKASRTMPSYFGIGLFREFADMAKRDIEGRVVTVPVDRHLELSEAARDKIREEEKHNATEFFDLMRKQLGITGGAREDAPRRKRNQPMSSAADTLKTSMPASGATD